MPAEMHHACIGAEQRGQRPLKCATSVPADYTNIWKITNEVFSRNSSNIFN